MGRQGDQNVLSELEAGYFPRVGEEPEARVCEEKGNRAIGALALIAKFLFNHVFDCITLQVDGVEALAAAEGGVVGQLHKNRKRQRYKGVRLCH